MNSAPNPVCNAARCSAIAVASSPLAPLSRTSIKCSRSCSQARSDGRAASSSSSPLPPQPTLSAMTRRAEPSRNHTNIFFPRRTTTGTLSNCATRNENLQQFFGNNAQFAVQNSCIAEFSSQSMFPLTRQRFELYRRCNVAVTPSNQAAWWHITLG